MKRLSLRRGVQLFVQVIILWVGAVLSDSAIATPQIPDQILIGGEFRSLHSTPLESYLVKRGVFGKLHRKKRLAGKALYWGNTTNHRGYVATWQVRNDTLLLLNVRTKQKFGQRETYKVNLHKEFGCSVVMAEWFSGTLTIPDGELIESMHAGFGGVYDCYETIWIEKGVVVYEASNHMEDSQSPFFGAINWCSRNMDALRFFSGDGNQLSMHPESMELTLFWQRKRGIALGKSV